MLFLFIFAIVVTCYIFYIYKKRGELLEWQRLIMQDSPNKLILSESQLKKITIETAQRELQIANDCVKILQTSKKPDVFFSRLALFVEILSKLVSYEKYIKFSGAAPSKVFATYADDYDELIHQFLFRYFQNTVELADRMKTEKGKFNKFKNFRDSLQPYYASLNEKHIEYIETRYAMSTQCFLKE